MNTFLERRGMWSTGDDKASTGRRTSEREGTRDVPLPGLSKSLSGPKEEYNSSQ